LKKRDGRLAKCNEMEFQPPSALTEKRRRRRK